MAPRFSRHTLTLHLQERIDAIQNVWGFDPSNGTNQIPYVAADCLNDVTLPAGVERKQSALLAAAATAYGEWSALTRVAEEFDLDVYPVHGGLYPKNLAPPAPSSFIRYRQR